MRPSDSVSGPIMLRVKRVMLTLGAIVAFAAWMLLLNYGFSLFSGIFFLGSPWAFEKFLHWISPIVHFADGVVVFGGVVALLNAIVAPTICWKRIIVGASVIGGIFVVMSSSLSNQIHAAKSSIYTHVRNISEARERNEESRVIEFVKNNEVVARAVGEQFDASISSSRISRGSVVQYDIYVYTQQKSSLHAFVKVTRSWNKTEFTLACISPKSVGMRNSHGNDCD